MVEPYPFSRQRLDAELARYPARSRLAVALLWATVGFLGAAPFLLVLSAMSESLSVRLLLLPALCVNGAAIVCGVLLATRAIAERASSPRLTFWLIISLTTWIALTLSALQTLSLEFNYGEAPAQSPVWLQYLALWLILVATAGFVATLALAAVRSLRVPGRPRA